MKKLARLLGVCCAVTLLTAIAATPIGRADGRSRVNFVLNGSSVSQGIFEAQLHRLVRSQTPRVSERIVNEDGSHGGHGKTFDARDPRSGERWLYMEVTLRDRDGDSRTSRVLRRARR